jgi:hypothetical protein
VLFVVMVASLLGVSLWNVVLTAARGPVPGLP